MQNTTCVKNSPVTLSYNAELQFSNVFNRSFEIVSNSQKNCKGYLTNTSDAFNFYSDTATLLYALSSLPVLYLILLFLGFLSFLIIPRETNINILS